MVENNYSIYTNNISQWIIFNFKSIFRNKYTCYFMFSLNKNIICYIFEHPPARD